MNSPTLEHPEFCRNVKQQQHWMRLIYMLILGVLLNLAGVVMWVLCGLQFLFVLGSGGDNRHLRRMARTITRFMEQGLLYVSYNSEHKPFPFAPWPEAQDVSANPPIRTGGGETGEPDQNKPDTAG